MAGLIVHEWLEEHGGAEKVVEEMAKIFPDAPIYSLWNDAPGRFAAGRVRESWLAGTPVRRHKGLALPLMPTTWRTMGSADTDWVLCSSHLFAHHFRTKPNVQKFVYAYTPARYIWTPEIDTRGGHLLVKAAAVPLRALDKARSKEASYVASISKFVQERIAATWERESVVIYPPVNVSEFERDPEAEITDEEASTLDTLPSEFILGASRFIPYKRLEDVILAGDIANIPVVLAGDGPSLSILREMALERPGRVFLIDRPSHALLSALYRRAVMYVFPPVEDFGIMPVEAMAAGTPVLANSRGGASETVLHSTTGFLVDDFRSRDVKEAIENAASLEPSDCRSQAKNFDSVVFQQHIQEWITNGTRSSA